MKTVQDLLEKAIYLSLKDRLFDPIPAGSEETFLAPFLPILNEIAEGVSNYNPGSAGVSIPQEQIKTDPETRIQYLDLTDNPFQDVFSVTFFQGSGSVGQNLKRLSVKEYGSLITCTQNIGAFPEFFLFNNLEHRLLFYPFVTQGRFFLIGKPVIQFKDLKDPLNLNPIMTRYLAYKLAQSLCSDYNTPFNMQKTEHLTKLENKISNISTDDTQEFGGDILGNDFAIFSRMLQLENT